MYCPKVIRYGEKQELKKPSNTLDFERNIRSTHNLTFAHERQLLEAKFKYKTLHFCYFRFKYVLQKFTSEKYIYEHPAYIRINTCVCNLK